MLTSVEGEESEEGEDHDFEAAKTAEELNAEQLKQYLENLRPEDFGKFNCEACGRTVARRRVGGERAGLVRIAHAARTGTAVPRAAHGERSRCSAWQIRHGDRESGLGDPASRRPR